MSLSKQDVQAIHARELARAKSAKDSKGNTNADPDAVAFNALRTEVHAALQLEDPIPGAQPEDEGDPEFVHMRQKAHGKKLWKKADALVAEAGFGAKGAS